MVACSGAFWPACLAPPLNNLSWGEHVFCVSLVFAHIILTFDYCFEDISSSSSFVSGLLDR